MAQDVAQAVSVITANDGCNFAIKGQGHAPAAGFANIDGGVTIDITSLNTTVLAHDRSVIKVGAGASWLQVYQYLDPFNVSVAGGRNGLVGIGGLTLGGGISHFTTRVGWACDNVVNFEV
jgi:FAD/FMN-containing dehydrogenase